MADTLFVVVAWAALQMARGGVGSRVIGPAGAGGGPLAEVVALSLNLAAVTILLAYIGAGCVALGKPGALFVHVLVVEHMDYRPT